MVVDFDFPALHRHDTKSTYFLVSFSQCTFIRSSQSISLHTRIRWRRGQKSHYITWGVHSRLRRTARNGKEKNGMAKSPHPYRSGRQGINRRRHAIKGAIIGIGELFSFTWVFIWLGMDWDGLEQGWNGHGRKEGRKEYPSTVRRGKGTRLQDQKD